MLIQHPLPTRSSLGHNPLTCLPHKWLPESLDELQISDTQLECLPGDLITNNLQTVDLSLNSRLTLLPSGFLSQAQNFLVL